MLSVFHHLRKRVTRTALAISTLTLAACVSNSGPQIDPNAAVPVALLVPAGSGQAGDELLARDLQNAARLAISDLGNVKIDLRVYPTAGQPAQAQSMALKAADEGAKIILGPLYGQEANAVGAAVAGRGINVLAFSNNPDIAGRNVFILGPTFENTAARLGDYARRSGLSPTMIVYDQNVAGDAGKTAIETGLRSVGSSVVGAQSYEFSRNGILSAAPAIAGAIRNSGAKSVFLTADSAGALPMISQALHDQGIAPPNATFMGLTRWDIPQATLGLPSVQNGIFALPDPGTYAHFKSRYQAAYGQPPIATAGLAYDGIAAIGALVKQHHANALTTAGLTQGAGFAGVNGIFRLNRNGTNERGLAIATIRNNQVTILEPAPRNFSGTGF